MVKEYLFKKLTSYFTVSLFCALVSTVSLIVISVFGLKTDTTFIRIITYIFAALFWAGLVTELVFIYKSCQVRQKLEKRINPPNVIKNIGFISFFRNREAMITDILLFIVAIALAVLNFIKSGVYSVNAVCFILFYLFFHLHSFLNGKNYRYIKKYKDDFKRQGATKNV